MAAGPRNAFYYIFPPPPCSWSWSSTFFFGFSPNIDAGSLFRWPKFDTAPLFSKTNKTGPLGISRVLDPPSSSLLSRSYMSEPFFWYQTVLIFRSLFLPFVLCRRIKMRELGTPLFPRFVPGGQGTTLFEVLRKSVARSLLFFFFPSFHRS